MEKDMGKFVTSSELNLELENLIKDAEEELIIISPYIKLHPEIRDLLKVKGDDPNIRITVVFGKNEDDFSESLNEDDFLFLKELKFVEIRYNSRLHAKYYANENRAILTSMNLHSYSQNFNIEFGIVVERAGLLNIKGRLLDDTLDADSFNYFTDVIMDHTELLFSKEPRPKADKKFSLRKLGYTHSEVVIDKLTEHYKNTPAIKKGYCIRTGVEIPFDPKKPMSWDGFNKWKIEGANREHPENYCHFSGEKSNGETSLAFPVMKKYYKKSVTSH